MSDEYLKVCNQCARLEWHSSSSAPMCQTCVEDELPWCEDCGEQFVPIFAKETRCDDCHGIWLLDHGDEPDSDRGAERRKAK